MRHTVGVADMAVSDSREDVIVTHALGSCVGIAIFDPEAGVGGMAHFMLPSSASDPEKAQRKPLMFGDLAIPALFQEAYARGARKERMRVVMAGGAQLFGEKDMFDIGRRNVTMVRKIFWKNGVLIASEDVGGASPRTLYLRMEDGGTWFTTAGRHFGL